VHDLRQAHASWLLAGGADLQVVKERLGHASIATTQKYLHTLPNADDTALDALAGSAAEVAGSRPERWATADLGGAHAQGQLDEVVLAPGPEQVARNVRVGSEPADTDLCTPYLAASPADTGQIDSWHHDA
jgi:Phage integrase family